MQHIWRKVFLCTIDHSTAFNIPLLSKDINEEISIHDLRTSYVNRIRQHNQIDEAIFLQTYYDNLPVLVLLANTPERIHQSFQLALKWERKNISSYFYPIDHLESNGASLSWVLHSGNDDIMKDFVKRYDFSEKIIIECLLKTAKYGHVNTYRMLINYLSINSANYSTCIGKSLLIAATYGRVQMIKHLIEELQVDINYVDPKHSEVGVLYRAVENNNIEVIQYLLDITTIKIEDILSYAMFQCDDNTLKYLLKKSSSSSIFKQTGLLQDLLDEANTSDRLDILAEQITKKRQNDEKLEEVEMNKRQKIDTFFHKF